MAKTAPFAERVSDTLQQIIQVVVGGKRKPPRRLKSFLNGTWFGHPIHPMLTDIPISAWLIAAVFDIIWLVAPTTLEWAARAAEITVLIGLLGAVGAAVTGLTDWSDTYGAERRTGLDHALFNVGATLLYLVSLIIRLYQPTGESIVAAIIGFIGLLCVLYAAYLGGKLVFTHGTNVNRTAWEEGSEHYEAVMAADQVEENKLYRVKVSGVPVALMHRGNEWLAISATCSHAGGPLDEGSVDGDVVECPWHGSRFCLRDGRVLTGPATVNAPCYDVRVENGQVELKRK